MRRDLTHHEEARMVKKGATSSWVIKLFKKKQENPGLGIVNVVNKAVSGDRIKRRAIGKQESVVSSRSRSLVERRSTTKDSHVNFFCFLCVKL
jgi:hypothetical protein